MSDESSSKPVAIQSPRLRPQGSDGALAASSYNQRERDIPPRSQYGTPPPNIPPRFTSSSSSVPSELAGAARFPSPRNGGTPNRGDQTPTKQQVKTPDREAANTPFENLDDLSDGEKAKVLRKHLVSKEERAGGKKSPASAEDVAAAGESSGASRLAPDRLSIPDQVSRRSSSSSVARLRREDTELFPLPYNAPGGDITHDIYKWQADHRREARPRTVSLGNLRPAQTDSAFDHIHEPGGFRRNYILLKANENGVEQPRVANNFIDFLYLFGHFAGEDLEEDETDDEVEARDEERALLIPSTSRPSVDAELVESPTALHRRLLHETSDLESTPLIKKSRSLSRSVSRARRRSRSIGGPTHGDATVPQAILMLLKSFIGTGILFLGKAFFNGGLLFSTVTLVLIAAVSLWSFLLLVETKFIVLGSFGDIGGALYGRPMRFAILSSIVISQLGFVCAYTIFVASNLQAFVMAVTNCRRYIPVQYLIAVQLPIFLPLSMIRNLAKLSGTALVADAFILIGLLYIGSNEVISIAKFGIADVKFFNPRDFPLLIGTAVFSFEGIGLVIPITDSMREPRRFPAVLTGVMIFLTILFGGFGALSYSAYGSQIQTVVLTNLPQSSKFVQAVQFLYSMAILLSAPLQLFPALRIIENALFKSKSGRLDLKVKWEKNATRALTVVSCYLVAWVGAKDLDKFVAFIGSFACIPLCYVYPAMLHYKACARTRKQKAADIALMIFGTLAAAFTTIQTIKLMFSAAPSESPTFGTCPSPV